MSEQPWIAVRELKGHFEVQFSPGGLDLTFHSEDEVRVGITAWLDTLDPSATVPIFIDTPRLEHFFEGIYRSMRSPPRRPLLRAIGLAKGPWPVRAPFRLPLQVLTVGAATPSLEAAIKSREWLQEIRAEGAGLAATGKWFRELLKRGAAKAATDILICTENDLGKVLLALRLARHYPRLIVALTDLVRSTELHESSRRILPQGTSLLMLPFGGELGTDSEAIVELMRDFAHDLPLHEFGRAISRNDSRRQRPSALVSHPDALDWLRLSQARIGLDEDILTLRSGGTLAAFDKFPAALQLRVAPLREALRVAQPAAIRLENLERTQSNNVYTDHFGAPYYETVLAGVTDFQREADALLPLTQMRRNIAQARDAETDIQAAVADALDDPELRGALLEQQARVVDISMQRLNADNSVAQFVRTEEALVAAAPYRVRVQVGRRSKVSIISGVVPPIDLLLPPPERGRRHVLNIALYTADFKLASPIMQRLELPEIGASPPVFFDIVPNKGITAARARIAIYYDLPPGAEGEAFRNHLIQSFLLTATVRGADEQKAGTGSEAGREEKPRRQLEVALEFSLDSRFGELEKLKPRLISFALNEGPPETHMLAIKRGADSLPVHFTEAEMSGALQEIRGALKWASHNDAGKRARFRAELAEGPEADFDKAIWLLAKSGRGLWHQLRLKVTGTPLHAALEAVINENDQLIQAVYLANFPFPWTAVYDFKLPDPPVGTPPTICKGFRRKSADGTPYSCGACLQNCLHQDKREAVCVYGFWGTRHQTEQLLATRTNKANQLRPIGPGAVGYMIGVPGEYLGKIPGDLTKKLGSLAQPIADNEDIPPMLWTAQRPAILLLAGHYKTEPKDGEREGPRLTLAGHRFLKPQDIIDESTGKIDESTGEPESWTDPRSIILLAACEGGVVDISNSVNFVNSFTSIGAGAVIGPETVIYEGLAHRFAVEMSEALVKQSSVGAAMLAFRRNLIRSFNPLGLVFTAYGYADLVADSPPASGSIT